MVKPLSSPIYRLMILVRQGRTRWVTFPIFACSGLGLWSSLGFSVSNPMWEGWSHLAYSNAVTLLSFSPLATRMASDGADWKAYLGDAQGKLPLALEAKVKTSGWSLSLYPLEGNCGSPYVAQAAFLDKAKPPHEVEPESLACCSWTGRLQVILEVHLNVTFQRVGPELHSLATFHMPWSPHLWYFIVFVCLHEGLFHGFSASLWAP